VQIPEETYMVGLEECKNHLHGKITLVKGDKSTAHLDMCKKLKLACKSVGYGKAIPLGKRFYEFAFTS